MLQAANYFILAHSSENKDLRVFGVFFVFWSTLFHFLAAFTFFYDLRQGLMSGIVVQVSDKLHLFLESRLTSSLRLPPPPFIFTTVGSA